ncbi:MAG: hypothetical protein GXO15_01545, partial [Crenarchaeota archaeon]|nr:hypothetical protein [Thermoproteota archaeon]
GEPRGFLGEALERALLRSRLLSSPPRPGPGVFREALRRPVWEEARPAVILEYKRCRPGRFVAYMAPWEFLELLGGAADAFSVLVEPYWFCGSPELVSYIAAASGKPVLAKDFTASREMLDLYQAAGASAALLIVDMLGWRRLEELAEAALERGLTPLIEAGNADDAVEAMNTFPEAVVGINARNLETLRVDLGAALRELEKAAARKPSGAILVAESGIDSVEAARRAAAAGADALLIGTWAMRSPREAAALPEALRGVLEAA